MKRVRVASLAKQDLEAGTRRDEIEQEFVDFRSATTSSTTATPSDA